jgi:hypothetical protein
MAGPAPSATPPPKRPKLELVSPKIEDGDPALVLEPETEVDEDHCTICLQAIADRAVIPTCSHEFCFECLMIWSGKTIQFSAYTQFLNKPKKKKKLHATQNNLDGVRSARKPSATT